ncbi:MAG: pimeloyl-CoA biosynthesis protein BioC [Rhodocyclaceae bacterium]|nr:pimeloyl-CoA biosynthesis protein BioC [Rhodocyclaceae bacterium]
MTQPPKHRVRQSFERAAATYDSAAQVQRLICDWQADALPATLAPDVVLDVGCGTGYALRLLRERFPAAALVALDLSPAMLATIRAPALRLAGDAERLPLAAASVGLYWSSLALQWCDLDTALAEARRVLKAGGHLAVSTLGPGTFAELRSAFSAADAHRHTLAFQTPGQIAARLAAAGFSDHRISRRQQVCHYPDLKTLLRAVKAVGANQVGSGRRPGLMSRTAWQRAEAAYEALRETRGLPLTYDVITIHSQK